MFAPRRLFVPVALLALAACSGDDDPTEPLPVVLDRIAVAPGQASLFEIGTSLSFDADGFTSTGAPVTELTFSWSSSDPSVATVSDDGTATATGFGSAVISATADGVTGRAQLVVRDCTEALQLAPGQWTSVPVPQPGECGVVLPSGDLGDRYRVAVVRATGVTCTGSTTPDCGIAGIDSVTVRTNPIGFAAGPEAAPLLVRSPPLAPSLRRRALPERLLESVRIAERTEALHHRLRHEERELVARLKLEGRFAEAVAPTLTRAPALQAEELPDRITLDNSTASNCSAGDQVVALKIYEDERLAFYQDSVQSQNADLKVSEAQARRMAEFYRDYGEDAITEYFGGISDVDGNGKVIVFFTPMVRDGTAAFVWSGDFFTRERCPASNVGEYIYFSASLTVDQEEDNWQSLETLVHEMKHVSSLKKAVDRPASFTEIYHPTWIEEGTAEIAANIAARRAWQAIGGPAQNARATGEMMTETGFTEVGIAPEFYGMAIRMLRTQGYLSSQPNAVTINPLGAGPRHSVYGSGFHFHRWLGDAYGNAAAAPGADADLFTDQNASSQRPGLAGLEALTGIPFGDLLTEYAAATMLNDDRFAAPAPVRAFTTLDFATGVEIFCFALSSAEWQELRDGQDAGADPPCGYSSAAQASGPDGTYPWAVTAEGGFGNSIEFGAHVFGGDIGNAGLRIHDFVSTGQGTGMEVQVEVQREPQVARLVVARIN